MGKILRVNLSTKTITQEDVPIEVEKKYFGGAGVAAAMVTQTVPPNTDPLSPENVMIFSVGPFCGTTVPFNGRHFVTTKSPLTGMLGEASAGGFFGKELKSTGIDHILFEGKSEAPVYLWIKDGHAELKSAENIWGKTTSQTEAEIKKELNEDKAKIASIGPAGEKLVKFASIMSEKDRAAGRCGVGAVMGSKNLKAIAVRGTKSVEVQNKEALAESVKKLHELVKESPMAAVYKQFGTPTGIDSMSGVGDVPVQNYTQSRWGGHKAIGAEALAARGEIKHHACYMCPVACTGMVKYNEEFVRWPEYETLALLGSNLLVDNLEAIIRWNVRADDLGVDTISLGAVIALFFEASEKGLIKTNLEELGFLPDPEKPGSFLIWGSVPGAEKLMELIAERKDIGNDLADGVKLVCEKYNLPPEFHTHVKGLEVPAHEPRANNMTALDYATTPRGAFHCYMPMHLSMAMNLKKEVGLDKMVDKFGKEEVVKAVIKIQNVSEAYCACGGCIFGFNFLPELTPWLNSLNAITGNSYNIDDWVAVGAALFNMKREYNAKCGADQSKDTLYPRFLTPILKGGTRKNVPPIEDMVKIYYDERGWNSGTPGAKG